MKSGESFNRAPTNSDKGTFIKTLKDAGMTYEPSPYDTSSFSEQIDPVLAVEFPVSYQELLQSAADSCRRYLSYPTITDSFTSHPDRRTWRNAMSAQFGRGFYDLLEQNRIKRNSLSALYSWFEIFKMKLSTMHAKSSRLLQLEAVFANLPTEDLAQYDALDLKQKRAVVDKIDTVALTFLRLVTLPND